jgi:lysozyme family protein
MTAFMTQKDVSFMDDAGKNVPGRLLSGDDGKMYKVFGKAAESIKLGTSYNFTVKSTDQKGVNLIDGRTLQAGDGAEPATPSAPPEPDKRQSSIEAQNALTNLTTLMVAKMLTPEYIDVMGPLEGALASVLMARAGIASAFAEKREPDVPANQLRPPRKPSA